MVLYSENTFGVRRRCGRHFAGGQPLQFRDFLAHEPHIGRLVALAAVGRGCQVRAVSFEYDVVQFHFTHRIGQLFLKVTTPPIPKAKSPQAFSFR